MPTPKIATKGEMEIQTGKKIVTDFESLRNTARLEADFMLNEMGNRQISPNANPGMLTSMGVATLVQQNQYIIKLLEVLISNS